MPTRMYDSKFALFLMFLTFQYEFAVIGQSVSNEFVRCLKLYFLMLLPLNAVSSTFVVVGISIFLSDMQS